MLISLMGSDVYNFEHYQQLSILDKFTKSIVIASAYSKSLALSFCKEEGRPTLFKLFTYESMQIKKHLQTCFFTNSLSLFAPKESQLKSDHKNKIANRFN